MEDNTEQAQMLGELLSNAGHDVQITFTGIEAWAVLQAKPFDVLLTDMQVPTPFGVSQSSGGLALIVEVRRAVAGGVIEWMENVRIIAISGAGNYAAPALQRAGTFGADLCLQKPISSTALIKAIESVLTQE